MDRVLVLVLVPVWGVCFGLTLRTALFSPRPIGWIPFHVTVFPEPGEPPAVTAMATFTGVEEAGLRVGDRVLAIGGEPVLGLDSLEFFFRFVEVAAAQDLVPMQVEREGHGFELRVPPSRIDGTGLVFLLPVSLSFLVGGFVILFKAPRSRLARAMFHFSLAVALTTGSLFGGDRGATELSTLIFGLGYPVTGALGVRAALLFPHGVLARRWTAWLSGTAFALAAASISILMVGFPLSGELFVQSTYAVRAAAFAAALAFVVSLYRRMDPLGRRQLKWSVLGLLCVLGPVVCLALWVAARGEDTWLYVRGQVLLALIPVFVYMAMYRYDLFDVDRLISSTAAYNVVLVVLAGAALFLVPRVGEVASAGLGLPTSAGQLGVALGLALLVVPAQRRLRPRLEALLFRERHSLEQSLEALAGELSGAADAKALLQQLGTQLHARVQPESTVLYGRDGERYAALFVEGRGAAAEIPADGPLVATLRQQRGPVCAEGELAGAGPKTRDPFARAALEVLNAAVVLPIVGPDGTPATLVSVGPKRSGDLYTSAELHLLRSVADRAALELARFDQQSFARESRAMQEAMRRYVPGAVADHIERGDALEAGEREVTVLFVDIRGYIALSEGSAAHAIFSTINRYTQVVSEIVHAEGGAVVEFNGDGMMAVFGAPSPLAQKERAAVQAARRIAEEIEGFEHEGRPVSVGMGIATGLNFVGNIQAADRMIWSAIGHTTNLAARLQALTRELDAAVVIDAPTWQTLGEDGGRFRRHEQFAIRGRSDRLDVFALRGRGGGERAAPAPTPTPEVAENELIRRGAVWSARFAGRRVDLPDAKGLHYLTRLLAAPGQEVHVLDLVAEVEGAAADPSSAATATAAGLGSARSGASGGDELLDDSARAAYRARLAELREELEEAEAAHDLGRTERVREEMAFLEQELSSATGLGGRPRRAASDEERARKAVYNRIRHVVKRLEAIHPDLAAHLDAAVGTGTTCAYRPERPLAWRLG